ncbi:unnamed protein product [Rotaria sp. Silwood1]|nr:unnamed protein product [Rotaria sp. Silwood1]CAF4923862.1 unnamed protein product [Rotaria sp. Silwood1]
MDMPAHTKCSLIGSSINILITLRHLVFGELHTFLYYRTTCRRDFKFYADRLIYLTVKEKKKNNMNSITI